LVLLVLGIGLLLVFAVERVRSGNWLFGPDILVQAKQTQWFQSSGAGHLWLEVTIRNRNQYAQRTVKQHWLRMRNRAHIAGQELLVNQRASSRRVGTLNPDEVVKGLVSFEVLNPPVEAPDYDLFIEDEFARVTKALKVSQVP
jgi:hypothetical protein